MKDSVNAVTAVHMLWWIPERQLTLNPEIRKLRRIEVCLTECKDVRTILRKNDSAETKFFLDPRTLGQKLENFWPFKFLAPRSPITGCTKIGAIGFIWTRHNMWKIPQLHAKQETFQKNRTPIVECSKWYLSWTRVWSLYHFLRLGLCLP